MPPAGRTPAKRTRKKAPEKTLDPVVESVVKDIRQAEAAYHLQWEREVTQRWNDYHAVVEEEESKKTDPNDPEDWHSAIFPAHLVPVIEGMIAAQVEPTPHLIVTPRPRPLDDLAALQNRMDGADIAEVAVNWSMQNDGFPAKQRPYIHQDMVAGLTFGKFYWDERYKTSYRREFFDVEEEGEWVRDFNTIEWEEPINDSPTFDVRDVRDLFWPANAREISKSDWLADRTYQTLERIAELEAAGVYLKGTTEACRATSLSQQGNPGSRPRYGEGGSSGPLRTEGLVEVIERWTSSGVCAIGNRQVKMRDEDNPFWHGGKPYEVTSAIPNFMQINGMSIVQVLGPIQRMIWFLSNQSMDNLKLINNLVLLIRADIEDSDKFKWYPGAQWEVDDPESAVKALEIDGTTAAVSLQREGILMGLLQNLMGALPGTGNVDSQTVDQQTATGMSIITNIAQQVIQIRKMAYQTAFARVGGHFLDLMRQFMVMPRLVGLLGHGGARIFTEIDPEALQEGFDVTYDIQGDSMVRQERRAEAQAFATMIYQFAPIQSQFGTAFNLDAVAERFMKAFDISNPKIYFMTPGQAKAALTPGAAPGGGGGGGQSGQPGVDPGSQGMIPPGMGPLGSQGNSVTAAPGAGVSTSPPTQQMLAITGPQQ